MTIPTRLQNYTLKNYSQVNRTATPIEFKTDSRILDPSNPGILGAFLLTNWKKNFNSMKYYKPDELRK